MTDTAVPKAAKTPDRRARRRLETMTEILDLAEEVMTAEGVAGLSLAEVARRLGVQPPSLYKYFPSLAAVYDALFERGQVANLEVMRAASKHAAPGIPAVAAALGASGRFLLEHPALGQLLFSRPVPQFHASDIAMTASREMVELQREMLRDAVAAGQLGPGADSDDAVCALGAIICGVCTMAIANEPGESWGKGRFTSVFPRLLALLPALYPPN